MVFSILILILVLYKNLNSILTDIEKLFNYKALIFSWDTLTFIIRSDIIFNGHKVFPKLTIL